MITNNQSEFYRVEFLARDDLLTANVVHACRMLMSLSLTAQVVVSRR